MKKILLTLLFFVALIQMAFSQFIYNEDGEPQPFSISSPYREMIKPEVMQPNYVTKEYNNDSLLHANNPTLDSERLVAGFAIDSTAYNFKEVATHFDIGHGDLWLYKLTSPTAEDLSVEFNKFILPDGALISFFQLNDSSPLDNPPQSFSNYTENKFNDCAYSMGNELFIEYYEPKNLKVKQNLVFKYIGYGFTNGIRINKKKDDTETMNLKSTGFGTDYNSLGDCGCTLPCSNVLEWKDASKSVAFIHLKTKLIAGSFYLYKGTGFFVNKSNNYQSTDYPYIVTAGHNFIAGISPSNFQFMELWVNYEDMVCGDPKPRKGSKTSGFNVIKIGTSYNIDPNNSSYIPNEDYALLQSKERVSSLGKKGITYAGWSSSHNYLNQGYVYIGHPNGDIKTVNIETDRAWQNPDDCFFNIYNKVGLNEAGFSGSPVFYMASEKVVGWVSSKEGGDFFCGDGDQFTTCGLFSSLLTNIGTNINPDLLSSVNTWAPQETVLPSHCSNCSKDGDETDIDCGGSCQPCGMADDMTISSETDFYGKSNLNARFNLTVNGNSDQINFKSQNYTLTAGESIKLKNTKISNLTSFSAIVDNEQKYADNQGCQDACVLIGNVFSPNGDGQNDYLLARFAFVQSYSVKIYDKNNSLIYSSYNNPVFENGVVAIWNGEGANSNIVYLVVIKVVDCKGVSSGWAYDSHTSCFKSEYIDYEVEEIIDPVDPLLILYPNPTSEELNVDIYNPKNTDQFSIKINDLSGKKIKTFNSNKPINRVPVSDLTPGVYIISVEVNKKMYSKKFIKQ